MQARLIELGEQEFPWREDRTDSDHATGRRCRAGQEPERRDMVDGELTRERLAVGSGHPADLQSQEQGYPKGRSLAPLYSFDPPAKETNRLC